MIHTTSSTEDESFVALIEKHCEQRALRVLSEAEIHIIDLIGGDATHILQWVQDNFMPEDVFSEKQLKEWAKANFDL